MARIGIITCSNCTHQTQETNCLSVVCLADMRKHKGRFNHYPKDGPLELVRFVHRDGCPTAAASCKIFCWSKQV
jgi:hypothetical protein